MVRKKWQILALIGFGVLLAGVPHAAEAVSAEGDQTLVMLKKGDSIQKFMKENELDNHEVIKSDSLPRTFIVDTPKSDLVPAGANLAPRHQYKALFNFTSPDPLYPQWYTTNTHALAAWDTTTGDPSTTVAVIDTGFALGHEDLVGRWAAGGKDFVSNDNDPSAGMTNPDGEGVSHGTQVAGLIGATGNNGIGVAGINWRTKLLALQALSDDGVGYTDDIVAAVDYAVAQGVKVINLSLGSPSEDPWLTAAIDNAVSAGVTVVAAAGNCGGADFFDQGCDFKGEMLYPAKQSNVIAVGATDANDDRAYFSSYGAEVDLVAPGSGNLQSTTWRPDNHTSAYTSSLFGTSFSSPIVAGAAALQLAVNPSLTPAQIRENLILAADRVEKMKIRGFTLGYGFGRLQLAKSLQDYSWTNALARLAYVNSTGDIYAIDTGRAYRVQSAGMARAWGMSAVFANPSSASHMSESTLSLLRSRGSLTRIARSDTTGILYLIDGGKRYKIAGSPSDEKIFGLWYGQAKMAQSNYSSTFLSELNNGGSVGYAFKSGSSWYVVDNGVLHKIAGVELSSWKPLLSGPTLSSDAAAILSRGAELKKGFRYGNRYYQVTPSGSIRSTTGKTTAQRWGVASSLVVSATLRDLLLE
jgi:subtilisin family serine protease